MLTNNPFWDGVRRLLLGLTNLAFLVTGLVCLYLGVHGLWQGDDLSRAGTGLTAGLVFLFAASIERFEVLKGLGIEARTRKLDEAISQANATVEQLRALAASFSQVALTELISGHFAYGMTTLTTRIELHDKLLQTLKGLGVSENKIVEADESWRRGIGIIYYSNICNTLEMRKAFHNVNSDAPEENRKAGSELRSMHRGEGEPAPTPKQIETFIRNRGLMTPELQAWIDDYQYYLIHNSIRRVDLFVA